MNTKTKAIIALVCGIVGMIGGFIPVVSYVAWLCPVAGLIFAILALKDKPEGSDKGMAVAGLVLSIIALAIDLLMLACTICVVGAVASAVNSGELQNALNQAIAAANQSLTF